MLTFLGEGHSGRHEEASMASSSNNVAAAPRGVHSPWPLASPIGLGSGTKVMSKSCARLQSALGPSAGVDGWLGTAAGLDGWRR
ncbi:hypothetical protein BD309DRAFT_952091 [Dichomitus squalens]|nr:hypothetical protein BD309DRAFT_952091 [Dichomitus squalens]